VLHGAWHAHAKALFKKVTRCSECSDAKAPEHREHAQGAQERSILSHLSQPRPIGI